MGKRLTDEEKRLFRRVLAMTKPYKGRLVLALASGMMFGGSLGGLLLAGKSGLSQAFGGQCLSKSPLLTECRQLIFQLAVNHHNQSRTQH